MIAGKKKSIIHRPQSSVPIPPPRRDITRAGFSELPAPILRAERAIWRFLEFFTANIRNKNTRAVYAQAISQFFRWCDSRGIYNLDQIRPVVIAGYIESHPAAAPTVKQHLAAIRMLFDWLVIGQVVEMNPASAVRGPNMSLNAAKRRCSPLTRPAHCSISSKPIPLLASAIAPSSA